MATQSVITAVVHELLNRESFATYVDLAETVKDRCAKLRLPYDAGRVSDAIRVVERTRPVLHTHRAVANPRHIERIDARPVSKADATRILARLGIRL
jgi:hypothetical protein